jgi:hypothetical protein
MLCHPQTLCRDMSELPIRMRRIAKSQNLHAEILAWQTKTLDQHFVSGPVRILREALEMKRRYVG